MKPIKISAVSYLNTKPFLWGLEQSGMLSKIELTLDIPAITAQKLISKQVDIGLVPVAILPELTDFKIITNFCIGTTGAVKTVCLFSEQPIHQVNTILLDYQSRTSVKLVELLCKHFWKVKVNCLPSYIGFENDIKKNIAGLIIGDRAINYLNKFNYVYDLGEAWKSFTQLPFVFAAWVSIKPLPNDFIQQLNDAFKMGVNHIGDIAKQFEQFNTPNFNVFNYFTQNIDYNLDELKLMALSKFLGYLNYPALSSKILQHK